MNIQGFQKLTLLDFPGHMACTVFTGGCNLHCPFCHNAGLVNSPCEAKSLSDEVLEYLNKRRGILDAVCITGGEPTLQPDLEDYIRKIKALGYKVKLDTNGYLPKRLQDLIDKGLLDYVAMDIKSSLWRYGRVCGADIDMGKIKKSIDILMSEKIDYEFRTTVAKPLFSKGDFVEIGKMIKGAKRYYLQGFLDSGDIVGEGISAYSEDEMRAFLGEILPFVSNSQIR
jgi:pyruvate formate lyase activating enzyme